MMVTGVYRIAEHCVRIESVYETVHVMCAAYADAGEPECVITITPADIEAERAYQGANSSLLPQHYETAAVYRRLVEWLLEKDIVLFHGSCLAVGGNAYLFTAPSGTGKSTHAALWRKCYGEEVTMVNDDKPLLKITPQGVVAYGTPWNGKHRLGENIAVPLRAICFLERGTENRIEPAEYFESFPNLLSQVYRPEQKEALEHTLSLLDTLAEHVRFYRLTCTMDPAAAEVARQGLEA